MASGVIRQSNHRLENLFFPGMAVLILAAVFLGFARSYYLAGLFKAPLPNLIVQSISDNDFECLARTGVNTPGTM
jgi:hypothetical protein